MAWSRVTLYKRFIQLLTLFTTAFSSDIDANQLRGGDSAQRPALGQYPNPIGIQYVSGRQTHRTTNSPPFRIHYPCCERQLALLVSRASGVILSSASRYGGAECEGRETYGESWRQGASKPASIRRNGCDDQCRHRKYA